MGSLVSPQPVKVTAEPIVSAGTRSFGDSGRAERDGKSKAVVRSELFGSWVFEALEHRDGAVDGHLTVILPRDLDDPAVFAFELEGALRSSGVIDASAATERLSTPGVVGDTEPSKPAPTESGPTDIDPFS
jgi:hypothetical protein